MLQKKRIECALLKVYVFEYLEREKKEQKEIHYKRIGCSK
jgi:hypothetical protein